MVTDVGLGVCEPVAAGMRSTATARTPSAPSLILPLVVRRRIDPHPLPWRGAYAWRSCRRSGFEALSSDLHTISRVGSHAVSGALLSEIRVVNFRSARHLHLRPGPICAFIGEPGAGKSNALFALRALLDPGFDLALTDVTFGESDVAIE